jgi:glutamine phosphoribosylpyrophosphate amidotransferase
MCAVIGTIICNPSDDQLEMIRRVFLESKIRGMHATGISFIGKDGTIQTHKEPVPADRFSMINNLSDCLADDGNLYMIGHCRYSTSDLEYNQPLYHNDKSIVHNGVITQELPENWKELYGYDCITKNDSELVLHSEDPLQEFPDMSMGVCELRTDKTLRSFRNGKRPLYLTTFNNGCIITSTKDIPHRAGVDGFTTEFLMNTYVTFDEHLAMMVERKEIVGEVDYQHYELC